MEKNVDRVTFNAEIKWAFLNERNEMSGKYQVDLCNLSKAAVERLEELGIVAKHKDDNGFFITCKSEKFPITAQRTDGSVIGGEIKVANGSKARATIQPYSWSFKNKKGKSASLVKLVITELIEFKKGAVDDGDNVDGDFDDLESDVL